MKKKYDVCYNSVDCRNYWFRVAPAGGHYPTDRQAIHLGGRTGFHILFQEIYRRWLQLKPFEKYVLQGKSMPAQLMILIWPGWADRPDLD